MFSIKKRPTIIMETPRYQIYRGIQGLPRKSLCYGVFTFSDRRISFTITNDLGIRLTF